MSPIIIIGAPRSGTKMLRELLKLHPEVAGSLHEEERVWSYGNSDRLSRSLKPEHATHRTKRYIRKYFESEERKNSGKRIVAKNVANTFRIQYIREIFPNAPIINIFRDGRDTVFSAKKRWEKPIDTKYMIKNKIFKEKNFPIREIPFFIKRQLKWALQGKKQQGHLQWWGPKFDDFEELAKEHTLIELCAIQWVRSIEVSLNDLAGLDPITYINIKYEDLVLNPENTMNQLYAFLELSTSLTLEKAVKTYVDPSSIGKWKESRESDEFSSMIELLEPSLGRIGYDI